MSQCTFWCRVLTDSHPYPHQVYGASLNAPSGAGCLPTRLAGGPERSGNRLNAPSGAGCLPTTCWRLSRGSRSSQCTFWCRVLTDTPRMVLVSPAQTVSMHLLVPGAYRRRGQDVLMRREKKSQCTFWCRVLTDRYERSAFLPSSRSVSMHLLVPGAYRLPSLQTASQHRLLDDNRHRRSMHPDSPVNTASIRPHFCGISPLNGNAPPIAQTPPSAPTLDGATPKSPPLSELSQHLRVHSRLTAKPKQMRALKTPTSHSRVRASGAGDSRGARATAVADAMAHRSKSQP